MRHHRRAGRTARAAREGDRGAGEGIRGERRAREGIAEPRQKDDGSLQVSAHRGVCGGTAQDHQRQDTPRGDTRRRRQKISAKKSACPERTGALILSIRTAPRNTRIRATARKILPRGRFLFELHSSFNILCAPYRGYRRCRPRCRRPAPPPSAALPPRSRPSAAVWRDSRPAR